MKCFGSRSSPRVLRLGLGSAVACVLALSGVAQAADSTSSQKAAAPSGKAAPRAEVRVISIPLQECPADDNEGMKALKAFIDPETGELRAPTPEEEAALARAIAGTSRIRTEAAREVTVGANGIMTYVLGEEGMEDVVVRTGSDGKAVFLCTPRSETPGALTRPLAPKKNEAAKEEK